MAAGPCTGPIRVYFCGPTPVAAHVTILVNSCVSMQHATERVERSCKVFLGSVGMAAFCIADRLPVVVRFPAGPRVSLKW